MDAAAEVLNNKGYAGTRLSDIADVVQVQAPAIYYYFASREELIEQVIEVGQREVVDHVKTALRAAADAGALDRILVAVRAHLDVVLERSQYTSASVRNIGQLPDDMRTRQLKLRAEYGRLWRDLFVAGLESGELNPELDLYTARMLVLGALNWAPEWWDPKRGSLESITRTAEQMVRTGLARR